MNLPNILTVLRMLLIPVFIHLYRSGSPIWALVVFLLAAATDVVDGYLARKWNQITSFGKLMDPLADKLMTLSMIFCLVEDGRIPLWVLLVMVFKECLMVLGSLFLLKGRKVVVMANWAGKAATALIILSVALVFPWHGIAWLYTAGRLMLYAAVACSLYAMAQYALLYLRDEKES